MTFQFPENAELVSKADLQRLTNALIEDVKKLLQHCVDADVTFVPVDPMAHDPAAASSGEAGTAWTLGHIIVHMTASSEESAMLAAELARGVTYHGRSRSEIPWTAITTVAQCRARLEESRRMRLASLDMWPDLPHLSNTYFPRPGTMELGPVARFLSGLKHDDNHLDQLREVIRQARTYRFQQTFMGRLRLRLRRSSSGATTSASADPLEKAPVS
jgi:hypothetical protein